MSYKGILIQLFKNNPTLDSKLFNMKKFLPFSFAFLILLGISCSTEEPKPTYNLSLSITPAEGGKVTVSPQSPKYQEGEVITLTPEPNENWVFDSWGIDLSGIEKSKTLIMNSDKNVEAKFKRKATLTSLNCNSATNIGTITSGVSIQGDVKIVIPYSGALGGTHNGQSVTSTGVTGLTATLPAGTFAIGSGNLTYFITGTPSTAGTASFAINIGEQNCVITILVSAVQVVTLIVEVKSPKTGRIWMDRNLGASRAATNRYDEASFGDLYQWGRGADGHQLRNSTTTTIASNQDQPGNSSFIISTSSSIGWRVPRNNNLWQGANGINNPCPAGFRIPTEQEWQEEFWGQSTTGCINMGSVTAFQSFLKLPTAGSRNWSNGVVGSPEDGGYWTSESSMTGNHSSRVVRFSSFSICHPFSFINQANGYCVRCIKN